LRLYVFENRQFHPELRTDGKGNAVNADANGIPTSGGRPPGT
jgi:hypothetical protein